MCVCVAEKPRQSGLNEKTREMERGRERERERERENSVMQIPGQIDFEV